MGRNCRSEAFWASGGRILSWKLWGTVNTRRWLPNSAQEYWLWVNTRMHATSKSFWLSKREVSFFLPEKIDLEIGIRSGESSLTWFKVNAPIKISETYNSCHCNTSSSCQPNLYWSKRASYTPPADIIKTMVILCRLTMFNFQTARHGRTMTIMSRTMDKAAVNSQ